MGKHSNESYRKVANVIKKELYFYEEIILTTLSVLSSMLISKFESYIQLPGICDKFFRILKFEI